MGAGRGLLAVSLRERKYRSMKSRVQQHCNRDKATARRRGELDCDCPAAVTTIGRTFPPNEAPCAVKTGIEHILTLRSKLRLHIVHPTILHLLLFLSYISLNQCGRPCWLGLKQWCTKDYSNLFGAFLALGSGNGVMLGDIPLNQMQPRSCIDNTAHFTFFEIECRRLKLLLHVAATEESPVRVSLCQRLARPALTSHRPCARCCSPTLWSPNRKASAHLH
jgi:hypothetical protein